VVKDIYFNITYSCNSRCLFCASDSPYIHEKSQMKFEQIQKCLQKFDITEKDRITINGGEPTVHPEIIEIIRSCSETDAKVILFTNGRKMEDPQVAKQLIEAGTLKVAIPLYSHSPSRHDYLTQAEGSFSETVRGIDNLTSLKNSGFSFEIELKTLFCKYNLRELPRFPEWIAGRFPRLKDVLLSSMNLSRCALQHQDQLFITFSDAQEIVNEFVGEAFNLGMNLSLCFIPLCLLDSELREKVLQRRDPSEYQTSHYYFDPSNLQGICGFQSNAKAGKCVTCGLCSVCDGVWDTYGKVIGYNEMTPLYDIDSRKRREKKGGVQYAV